LHTQNQCRTLYFFAQHDGGGQLLSRELRRIEQVSTNMS